MGRFFVIIILVFVVFYVGRYVLALRSPHQPISRKGAPEKKSKLNDLGEYVPYEEVD